MNQVLPLVRYVLGDLAHLEAAPCRCNAGSSWPRVVLEGRAADLMRAGGRWVSTRAVDEALSSVRSLDFYQVQQTAPDVYDVRIIATPGRAAPVDDVTDVLKALLGNARVTVMAVRWIRPEGGQKFRFTAPHKPHAATVGVEHPGLRDALLEEVAPC